MTLTKILRVCAVVGVCCALFPAETSASPIPYVIELTVNRVDLTSYGVCGIQLTFSCDVAVGDHFVGTFSLVDTSILAGGVPPVAATVAHFSLAIAGLVWAQDFPWPISAFRGFFLGDVDGDGFNDGYTGDQIGVVVSGGDIVSFAQYAGVVGFPGPWPYYNVSGLNWLASDQFSDVYGTYVIRRVPEPASFALVILALGIIGWVRTTQGQRPVYEPIAAMAESGIRVCVGCLGAPVAIDQNASSRRDRHKRTLIPSSIQSLGQHVGAPIAVP